MTPELFGQLKKSLEDNDKKLSLSLLKKVNRKVEEENNAREYREQLFELSIIAISHKSKTILKALLEKGTPVAKDNGELFILAIHKSSRKLMDILINKGIKKDLEGVRADYETIENILNKLTKDPFYLDFYKKQIRWLIKFSDSRTCLVQTCCNIIKSHDFEMLKFSIKQHGIVDNIESVVLKKAVEVNDFESFEYLVSTQNYNQKAFTHATSFCTTINHYKMLLRLHQLDATFDLRGAPVLLPYLESIKSHQEELNFILNCERSANVLWLEDLSVLKNADDYDFNFLLKNNSKKFKSFHANAVVALLKEYIETNNQIRWKHLRNYIKDTVGDEQCEKSMVYHFFNTGECCWSSNSEFMEMQVGGSDYGLYHIIAQHSNTDIESLRFFIRELYPLNINKSILKDAIHRNLSYSQGNPAIRAFYLEGYNLQEEFDKAIKHNNDEFRNIIKNIIASTTEDNTPWSLDVDSVFYPEHSPKSAYTLLLEAIAKKSPILAAHLLSKLSIELDDLKKLKIFCAFDEKLSNLVDSKIALIPQVPPEDKIKDRALFWSYNSFNVKNTITLFEKKSPLAADSSKSIIKNSL